jgi:hypothetical protein
MAILIDDVLNLMNYKPSEVYNSDIPKLHPDYKKWLKKLPAELSSGISVIVVERDDGSVKAVSGEEGVDILAQTEKLTISIYSPLNLDSFAHEVGHALSNKFELKKLLAKHPRAKNPLFDEILADLVKSFLTKIGFMGESTKSELKQVLGKHAYGSLR